MSDSESVRTLFLAWESPWPAHSGAAIRSLGLLEQISQDFAVHLLVLTRCPLDAEQIEALNSLAHTVTRIPLRDVSLIDKLRATALMVRLGYPYHSAVLEASLRPRPEVRRKIQEFPGIVFAAGGQWGMLIRNQPAPNWILNQFDADVEFWRVYASQVSSPLVRVAALINLRFAEKHFPQIYRSAGCVISVCEEDKLLTQSLAPQARIEVVENGIDCTYFAPDREKRIGPPRMLFTGTSARRNMFTLHRFVSGILPLIHSELPDAELLVAGNFSPRAQAEFAAHPRVRFTGQVDDIRSAFNQSDIFIVPFEETHGSKLKVAEAMAMGMAIVSTPQGIRGFSLVDGESVLIAHDERQFAVHAVRLLEDPDKCAVLGARARELALSTIDWHVLGERLMRVIGSVAGPEWTNVVASP